MGRKQNPFLLTEEGSDVIGILKFSIQARSSGGERYLDTVEVTSSNLVVPTSNKIRGLSLIAQPLFLLLLQKTSSLLYILQSIVFSFSPRLDDNEG